MRVRFRCPLPVSMVSQSNQNLHLTFPHLNQKSDGGSRGDNSPGIPVLPALIGTGARTSLLGVFLFHLMEVGLDYPSVQIKNEHEEQK